MTTYKRRYDKKKKKEINLDDVFGYNYNPFYDKKSRYRKKDRKAQSLSYKKKRYSNKYQIGETDAYWEDINF